MVERIGCTCWEKGSVLVFVIFLFDWFGLITLLRGRLKSTEKESMN